METIISKLKEPAELKKTDSKSIYYFLKCFCDDKSKIKNLFDLNKEESENS